MNRVRSAKTLKPFRHSLLALTIACLVSGCGIVLVTTATVMAIDIARELVREHNTLSNLARTSVEELQQVKGIGRDKAVTLKAAFTLARRMAVEIPVARPLLDDPERIADHMREEFRDKEIEEFHTLLLDARRRLIRAGNATHVLKSPRDATSTSLRLTLRPTLVSTTFVK